MAWPSIRAFLDIPDHLTGRGVAIAVVDGTFAGHPDIAGGAGRRSRVVLTGRLGAEPEPVPPVVTPWPAGAHGLWSAAAAGGSGAASAGTYAGAAPEADLLLLAGYLEGIRLTDQQRQLTALRWLRENWRRHQVRGVVTAIVGESGSGLLPWQAEPLRVACEELCDDGLLVVAGTGNQPDCAARVAQAAAPSVLAVGGVVIPALGPWQGAAAFHGCRGSTFEGKWTPEVLAPAENLVLPYPAGEDPDVPPGHARIEGTSHAGPIVLGAAACLWQAHPEWSALQVRRALVATARQRPAWSALRAGLVDVEAAARWPVEPSPAGVRSPYGRYLAWRDRTATARIAAARDGDGDGAVEALLSFLPDQVTDEAAAACAELLGRGSPRLTAAALCVMAARPEHVEAELLASRLSDANAGVRAAALRAVRAAPHVWGPLTPRVATRLADVDADVCQAAAQLAGEMRATGLVPALVDGFAEDVRRRRPACFAARTRALEQLTGAVFRPQPEWRVGEPLFDDRWWLRHERVAASWREWLGAGRP